MDIQILPEQLKDWLVARWALNRIEALRQIQPERAASLERCFTAEVLEELSAVLEPDDEFHLFRVLSPELWAKLAPDLLDAWPPLLGRLAWIQAETLARIAPEAFVSKLAEMDLEQELDGLMGLADTLLALPAGYGAAESRKLMDFVMDLGDDTLIELLCAELIGLSERHGLGRTSSILQRCFERTGAKLYLSEQGLAESYARLCPGLPYYQWVLDRQEQFTSLAFEGLEPLFEADAPVAELLKLAGQPELWERLPGLLGRSGPLELSRELLACGNRSKELNLFVAALALATWACPRIDWAGMPAARIARLGSVDLNFFPNADSALERLRELPRQEVVEALESVLLESEESRGSAQIARWMGQLGYPEFIRPLRASLDSSINDELAIASAVALGRLGVEAAWVERWDELTEAQQEYGAEILPLIGGESTIRMLLERRSDLAEAKLPLDLWTEISRGLPDPRLLEVLEAARATQEDFRVQEAYLMQRLLLGRDGDDLQELYQRVLEEAAEEDHAEGGPESWDETESLVVEARCSLCGHVDTYEGLGLFADFEHPDRGIVNGAEICDGCDEAEGLELTESGLEMLRDWMSTRTPSDLETDGSPVQIAWIHEAAGRRRTLADALDHYESALARKPGNFSDLFMLGRCWRVANHYSKAERLYEECLELEPGYVPASMDWAEMSEPAEALEILEGALGFKERWRMFQHPDHAAYPDVAREFAMIYNDMLDRSVDKKEERSKRRISISDLIVEKPGRNDACPCGSGKKYKKCCLAKSS